MKVDRLPWAPERIADEIERRLRDRVGTWTAGIYGALAEFCVAGDEPAEIHREDLSLTSQTCRGGLRVEIGDAVVFEVGRRSRPGKAPVLVVATPRPGAGWTPDEGVRPRGPDRDALRVEDRGMLLFDLGLGSPAARFQVRTDHPGLVDAFEAARGEPWPSLMASVGELILEVSPPRVVATPLGRIEVYARIPGPGERSPDGPHTHLLPRQLAKRRESAPGTDLPDGWMPAVTFHSPRR